ncbi:MAG: MEDS domain-containing protein [Bacillota bacterium]|jgi:two-component sensor histidine kinase
MGIQVMDDINIRKTGITFIDDIPWGTHICGFYETNDDLVDILVPYFKAGLENNEFCMWVVSDPISVDEAAEVLKNAIPEYETYLSQIEIIHDSNWYTKNGYFRGEEVLEGWLAKINYAITKGYEGLRLCGSTTWLNKRLWKTFLDYEADIEREIGKLKMIALCPYRLGQCGIHEILDVVNNHQFSFIKSKYDWKYSNAITKFDRLKLISQMAAGIAHEVRNPMTTVRGFIQLLQSKNDFQSYNDYFNIMIDELDRANDIISEYLSLARDKDKNVQKHNLNSIINALYPLLQADAVKEDKDIIFHPGEIENILVDPKDIRQVILNLSKNGLEAMKAGGVLEIRTFMEETGAALEIKDTGNGIPEEIINDLGTPFLTTKENGTGLGLSVCFKILDSYNAKVKVDSSPQGTRFIISFPRNSAENSGGNSGKFRDGS